MRETMLRITHRNLITKEGNPFGPICTGHNQHTHTGNTRQPELNSRVPRVHPPSRAQLELSLIHIYTGNTRQPERNSRVPRVHPPSRAPLEGCHSELNSRNATRAIHLDPSVLATTSTLTPATLAHPSATQGFLVFIRHPELHSRDAIPSSTRGMLRASPLSQAPLKGYVPVSCTPLDVYKRQSQDYRTRQLITKAGNPFGPICPGHNQHTHAGNTRPPERNSRVPRVHPPSRAPLEGCHSELNSRNATTLTPATLAHPSATQGFLVFIRHPELHSRDAIPSSTRGMLHYRTRQLITKAGNPFGPICPGHNQHTHAGNTRPPERNSRVPRVHPPSRAQLEGCHSELNSRNATCLTPIPSSTQGIRSELNSRNTSNPTFEVPPEAL
ncbi:hypothetical protein DEO72_LG6g751 [Vigna unguiculata]|uniref:Uncharacterized protein n=1 Tax=Vigna unguiculata TaxID=3917 RepID=A0A4D6M3Z3_VIGUN|nr:hypothetical protein DEO72_LG6g751 [Vigna unguiculata]